MSLKADIEKIFVDNTNYANPSQAVNQASSLNALSADLYTDSKRFIYELLQNADDSSQNSNAVKVWIKIFDDKLVIAHSGSPFTARDLKGICNVNNGTKKSDLTKTGYKGIGFKSVFGQSDKVTIYTKDEYFRFDASYLFEWKWEESKTICDLLNNGIWTHHLVKALSGSAPEVLYENKYITDISLMEYLSSSVSEYAKKELGFKQNPKAILDSSHENVIAAIKNENI